jgi:hypothetical protein
VKHSIRRRADRARSSMPQQAAHIASFRARRRLKPPLRRPLARRRAVNRYLHYAFTRRAWPARALNLLIGAVSTRWAVQLLTSSDHAHTTVVSTRSPSDRLEGPRADALVDYSDRRVRGCLDSSRQTLLLGVTPLGWPNSETSLLCGYDSAGLQFISIRSWPTYRRA